jgi:glycosyltransferase involved in cell wall biosynthesis
MIRVGFTLPGARQWTGGYNYLLNLLQSIAAYESHRLAAVLLVDAACSPEETGPFSAIEGVELVRSPLLGPSRRVGSLLQALLLGRDLGLGRLLRECRVGAVFESAQFFGWRLGLPAIAWIPDLQHRALPQLFARGAWWRREIGFRVQIASGRTIMLSSEDARLSCEHYYPSSRGHTRTVHFAVPAGPETPIAEARAVADGYGLPEHYFFLPNQFWPHKNHELVLESLAMLRDRGVRVAIAATGNPSDPRDAGYFPAFRDRLERLGLQREFRLLGVVPYAHVRALMRAAAAMLNPSLAEGWSTTVEEAKAMGTPMLLSDLPVHLEQAGEGAIYFDRHSPVALADALERFHPLEREAREALEEAARLRSAHRVRRFAADFAGLVESACAEAERDEG